MLSRKFQRATFEQYADKIVERTKFLLKQKDLYATGKLYDSVEDRLIEDENSLSLEILALKYFKQIDKGRARGRFVSTSKILEWLRAKNIRSHTYTDKSIQEFAQIISNTIKEKGTIKRFGYKGANISDEIMNQYSDSFVIDVIEAFASDSEVTLDELFKNVKVKLIKG